MRRIVLFTKVMPRMIAFYRDVVNESGFPMYEALV